MVRSRNVVAVVVSICVLILCRVAALGCKLGRAAGGRFLEVVTKVRIGYPLLWYSSKRNRRVEVYYWLGHGMSESTLLK